MTSSNPHDQEKGHKYVLRPKGPNPSLNSDPANFALRSLSCSVLLNFVQLSAAGWAA